MLSQEYIVYFVSSQGSTLSLWQIMLALPFAFELWYVYKKKHLCNH